MALNELLADGYSIALDTNILIYYVEEHPEYLSLLAPVFDRIRDGSLFAHVSVMSLMEVLVIPFRPGEKTLAEQYREIVTSSRVVLHDLSRDIAERAAELRAQYRLTAPDAIVAATAIEAGYTHLITNDDRFRAVPNIEVLVIREYVA